jgi:hypothetical protein
MYVGTYESEFRKAFTDTLDNLEAEPFEASVKKIVDRLAEDVVDRVHDDVRDRLISAISDSICAKAAEVATRMLESALAGDDNELRNIFGFYQHPAGSLAHHATFAPRLQRWQLIDALVERRPDFFIDERLDELNEKLISAQRQATNLQKQVNWWRDKAEGREPGSYP